VTLKRLIHRKDAKNAKDNHFPLAKNTPMEKIYHLPAANVWNFTKSGCLDFVKNKNSQRPLRLCGEKCF
jgi:hypothetical protein